MQSPINLPSTTNILREHGPSLYLRGVGVKYWDNSIVIVQREMHWGTARAHTFLNSSLLENEGLLEILLGAGSKLDY